MRTRHVTRAQTSSNSFLQRRRRWSIPRGRRSAEFCAASVHAVDAAARERERPHRRQWPERRRRAGLERASSGSSVKVSVMNNCWRLPGAPHAGLITSLSRDELGDLFVAGNMVVPARRRRRRHAFRARGRRAPRREPRNLRRRRAASASTRCPSRSTQRSGHLFWAQGCLTQYARSSRATRH